MIAGSLLIRNVRVVPLDGHGPAPEPLDIAVRDGVVVSLGPRVAEGDLPVLEAEGAWALPGLWDAHVHVGQWVRRSAWHDVSGAGDAGEVCRRVRDVVDALDGPSTSGRRGDDRLLTFFGSRSATWQRPGTVPELDAVSGRHPVVVVAGDVHNGWLNSAALALLGVPPRTGPLAETEWFEVFGRLTGLPGAAPTTADERRVVEAMAARGITGLVDLELGDAFRDWPRRVAAGVDAVRVRAGCYPHQLADALALGVRSGEPLAGGGGLVTMGPLKVISDGSMGTRTAWCHEPYAGSAPDDAGAHGAPNVDAEDLARLMTTAHEGGLDVAVHAIGDRANGAALDAFEATGAHGTVEHAQFLRAEDVGRFARLGVAASVQPLHLLDDRDAADRLWPGRTHRLFPLRSLLDAGARVRFGSDAPVSPVDPWGAMAAAVHRSGDDRPPWHPEQAITPREALACSVDGRLEAGAPGDLVLVGRDPLWHGDTSAETAAHLREMAVLATVCAGRVTFDAATGSVP